MASQDITPCGSATNEVLNDKKDSVSNDSSKSNAINGAAVACDAELASNQEQSTTTNTTELSEQANEIIFPLLKLPPELWSRICKFAVVLNHDVIIRSTFGRDRYRERVRQPAIARTCRVVRKEALACFYSSNTFIIKDDWHVIQGLRNGLKAIGRSNYAHFKHLYFDTDMHRATYLEDNLHRYVPLIVQGEVVRRPNENEDKAALHSTRLKLAVLRIGT